MAYLDVKVTTWERAYIKDEDVEEVLRQLEIGEINHPSDFYESFDVLDTETLLDTNTYMSVEENEGFSTMEMFNEKGNVLWANGKH